MSREERKGKNHYLIHKITIIYEELTLRAIIILFSRISFSLSCVLS